MKAKKKPKSALSRIFELSGEHKGFLMLSGVLAAIATIASFIPYVAIYLIIKDVIAIYPDFTQLDGASLLFYGLLAVFGVALDAVCFFASSISAHIAAFGAQYKLRILFTEHLAKIPLGFHLNIGSGRFHKVLSQDIEQIENFIAHSYPDMIGAFISPLVLLILLFVFDWRFGLAAFFAVILAFGIQMIAMGTSSADLMEKLQQNQADMTEAAVEYVRGIPVLKAFGLTAHSFKQLSVAIQSYTKFMLRYTLKWKNSNSAFMSVINNIYLFILPVGIWIGQTSKDYSHFLLNFLFYLIFVPAIASVLHKFMFVSSAGMRVLGSVQIFDSMMALPELPTIGKGKKGEDAGICFKRVSFSYSGDENFALRDVSFTAPTGKLTAIVGTSGGGKSTIAHLIPRFWDVAEGSISIGGVDIREMDEEELMHTVSFVFQDVFLFGMSVRDNIAIGKPDATDEMIRKAAKDACCDEFIRKLPRGYETVLGEGGVHLSGGEAQRISIARAIIRNSPVLVLDEATAFADAENEMLIQQALQKLMEGKTVIMIAHRLGTIKAADQIIVMENGNLVESGKHAELIEKQGVYADMWLRYRESLTWGIGRETAL